MTDEELLRAIDGLRNTMIGVATGGPRIDDVNDHYMQVLATVDAELTQRDIRNPIGFTTLWDWYGRWSSGDLPTYQSRRAFVGDLIDPLRNRIRTGRIEETPPTGWTRVDRTVDQLRDRLAASRNEEDFQAVGLLARETLISLAQAVYMADQHPALDGTRPSKTDAKRMLDSYIAAELADSANHEARSHARSALAFANALQHRRTATFRDAALCVEATTAVVNIIAIVAGKRDPA